MSYEILLTSSEPIDDLDRLHGLPERRPYHRGEREEMAVLRLRQRDEQQPAAIDSHLSSGKPA